MSKKVLIATIKPFAAEAVDTIAEVVKNSNGVELELLEKYSDQNELIAKIPDYDALIVRSDKINKDVIAAASNLRIIVRAGAGYDNIDLQSASEKGIVVMNTPGQNANAVAELTFGLMLGLIRNKYNGTAGTELKGKKIGMHGFGNIGNCMSVIAKGFNMRVFAYDPFLDEETITGVGVQPCKTVEELYEFCHFISINIPATEETVGSINYNLLSKTKKNAVLLNTARKELIDEDALLKIMAERPEYMYASDVAPNCQDFMRENYPMRTLFTTQKMGAQTAEANVNAGVASINQIIKFFNEGDTTFQVN